MSPNYKLTYFDTPGRGEHIRYIFAYAGQEYEDYRISKDEWATLKPNILFGKLPLLEVDGKLITQSNAIARYLAKQFGLLGEDDWEAVQADALVDTLSDYRLVVMQLLREENPEKLAELEKEQAFYLGKFANILSKNPSGLLVGSKVTWADLTFAALFSAFRQRYPEVLEPYPALLTFIEKINNLPSIKAYLEKRPKSDDTPTGAVKK